MPKGRQRLIAHLYMGLSTSLYLRIETSQPQNPRAVNTERTRVVGFRTQPLVRPQLRHQSSQRPQISVYTTVDDRHDATQPSLRTNEQTNNLILFSTSPGIHALGPKMGYSRAQAKYRTELLEEPCHKGRLPQGDRREELIALACLSFWHISHPLYLVGDKIIVDCWYHNTSPRCTE